MSEEKNQMETKTLTEFTSDMKKYPGFYTFYWDEKKGKMWLEVDRFEEEFLYVNALTTGLGSNDVGLDRNQLGATKLVQFQRVGPKILLIQSNRKFIANSDNDYEKKAVDEAFAKAVIWGFKVEAEEDGRVLVDASEFYLNDAKNVVQRHSSQSTF